MSNLPHTTRLPLRTSMTNKWKTHALTNDLLERKVRALEGNLNKLKYTTMRDQTKSTMDISHRKPNIDLSQKTRNKSTVKKLPVKQIIKCGQCENADAKMKCLECVEHYCTNCYSQFHLRGALQRHHCTFLSPTMKKSPPVNHTNKRSQELQETSSEKSAIASFQKSFLEWREEHLNKSKRNPQLHRRNSPITERIDSSINLPSITSDENDSTKKSKTIDRTIQQLIQPKTNPGIHIYHFITESSNTNDQTIDRTPSHEEPSPSLSRASAPRPSGEENNLEENKAQEQLITQVSVKLNSRPNSSSTKKNVVSSRPNSSTIIQPSFRSLLATKSTEELTEILQTQFIFSRSGSATPEKHDQSITPTNNVDVPLTEIDQNADIQLDPDLLEETKIELSSRDYLPDASTPTPRRYSPFSFTNSLYRASRLNSASSNDTDDLGFFTDVPFQKCIPSMIPLPPLPILECSTLTELKHASDHQTDEQKPTDLSRQLSKHSLKQEEIPHQSKISVENGSRPRSSLSSSLLPISEPSSKPSFNHTNTDTSGSLTETTKDSSEDIITTTTETLTTNNTTTITETSKFELENSSLPLDISIPVKIEDSDTTLQVSTDYLKDKSLSNVNPPESTNEPIQPDLPKLSVREKHIEKLNNSTKKKTARRKPRQKQPDHQSTSRRKLEFSFGDGLKWQEASVESMSSIASISSKQSSPRSTSPSNVPNTAVELAEQYSNYGNDDGRSSRAYQNRIDEEYFNQLRQELYSELDTQGSDEHALMNEQLLRIVRDVPNPFDPADSIVTRTDIQ